MNLERRNKQFYFIAIGGVGMSALAQILLEMGYRVSGSDIAESKYTRSVEKAGAEVYIGHAEENVPEGATIVVSTAIKEDNIELRRARELGLEVLHRSDMLAFISKEFQSESGKFLGFSGTHGKTSTSGMASYVLERANLEPTYIVGGMLPKLGVNSNVGRGNFLIAELDESDGTILKYAPDVLVVNNLEADHLDFYRDGLSGILRTFKQVIENSAKTSTLINVDSEANCELRQMCPGSKFYTYSLDREADFTAKSINYFENGVEFNFYKGGNFVTEIKLGIPGKHNVYNALSVLSAFSLLGVDIAVIAKHFEEFTGMGRRYQFVGEFDGVRVTDDYAHHPTEIKATLDCARQSNPKSRIVAIFQPHRYSRLNSLYEDFLSAFSNADFIYTLETYAASEKPIVGGKTPQDFVKDIGESKSKYVIGTVDEVAEKIFPELRYGDFVITLGAGDITKVGTKLVELSEAREKNAV